MTAGDLYIADNDATWTWSADPAGGTITYDAAGAQDIWSNVANDFDNAYYNLVIAGSGTKSTNGPTYCVLNLLTVQSGAIFSADNANPSRIQAGTGTVGLCLDIQNNATVTGVGILDSYGNATVAFDATVDIFQISIVGLESEDSYFQSDAALFVTNFVGGSTGSPGGCSSYIGPATLTCTDLKILCNAAAGDDPPVFLFGANIRTVNVLLNITDSYLKDFGNYSLNVSGNITGTGRIVLDCGGNIVASSTSDITCNIIAIVHENSFIDADGEFDITGNLAMTKGNIYIADDDATIPTLNLSGGSVYYDRKGDQAVVPGSYYNLIMKHYGRKTSADNVTVKGTFRMEKE